MAPPTTSSSTHPSSTCIAGSSRIPGAWISKGATGGGESKAAQVACSKASSSAAERTGPTVNSSGSSSRGSGPAGRAYQSPAMRRVRPRGARSNMPALSQTASKLPAGSSR
jgi:hypothetical protein